MFPVPPKVDKKALYIIPGEQLQAIIDFLLNTFSMGKIEGIVNALRNLKKK